MIKRLLRVWVNKDAIEEIEQRIWEINTSMMRNREAYPHGHPHSNGMVDGLRFALHAIREED